jgi:(p)ppGpp synthase/HD superfamily hydrolase
MNDKNFDKLDLTLKYYLHGARYPFAIKAYHLAKQYHNGTRKDGITPEVQHQLEIALFIITLRLNPAYEELAIVYALLHDILEDFDDVTPERLAIDFGEDVVDDLRLISKKVQGIKTYHHDDQYYKRMAKVPLIALVKGVDRIHNLQSMIGVFNTEKQETYVSTAERHFLPMLKEAAKIDEGLFFSFQNVRTVLKCQIKLIREVIEATNIERGENASTN